MKHKSFLLFFWNGAIIIAKCGLFFPPMLFFSRRTALVKVKQVVYRPHDVLTPQGQRGEWFQLVSDQTFSTDSLASGPD